MGDKALGIAKIVGDAYQFKRIEKPKCSGLSAGDLEGNERRAAAHLFARNLRLRMIRAAGIDQARNLWMLRERNGDCCRSLGLSTHPQVQCFEALQEDPRVERRH